mmetsp:Transcript_20265/g.58766  ORF Transcript_20265/g.58766 Transcript_20265/m.58766 type:complete len:232 (+) Transcript_20265:220-915(+)
MQGCSHRPRRLLLAQQPLPLPLRLRRRQRHRRSCRECHRRSACCASASGRAKEKSSSASLSSELRRPDLGQRGPPGRTRRRVGWARYPVWGRLQRLQRWRPCETGQSSCPSRSAASPCSPSGCSPPVPAPDAAFVRHYTRREASASVRHSRCHRRAWWAAALASRLRPAAVVTTAAPARPRRAPAAAAGGPGARRWPKQRRPTSRSCRGSHRHPADLAPASSYRGAGSTLW